MTCAGCGCVCDDGRTCALGDAWLSLDERPPLARIDGREVSLDDAVGAAAAILRQARAPLVYGLGGTSIEAQRRAVGLAEAIGAVVDAGARAGAYQAAGSSSATLGEIRNRAELVVAWRADPVVTHPRLLERLRVKSLVVVDAERTATAEQADAFIEVRDDFGALRALRAGTRLGDLATRLRAARHVAFIYGALDELTALALFELVRDLSRDRHAVTLGLRAGNARGAEDVLAWQTGFSGPVSFARGHPREEHGRDFDATLVVAADPPAGTVPTVIVDPRATATAQVVIAPAADGIEVPGTVHRMDGVPLNLNPARRDSTSRPSVEEVLAMIGDRC
jgi:formylmethanofuran dehydrogenase subunit B